MNMNKYANLCLMTLCVIFCISCSDKVEIRSPDRNNSIILELDEAGTLRYSVKTAGIIAVESSRAGIEMTDSSRSFSSGLTLVNDERRINDETYTLPSGKRSLYVNSYNEAVLTFKNSFNALFQVICRAYNDGVAFRYMIDNPKVQVARELTEFSLPGVTTTWMMDYKANAENYFHERELNLLERDAVFSYPALMRTGESKWMLLTEASVYKQPATSLKKTGATVLAVELPETGFIVVCSAYTRGIS